MKSLLVLFVVTCLLPTLSMASQNYTRKPGYCMWYGQCGLSSTTKKPINCLYNGKAKNITDTESRKILTSLCPELVLDNEGICCSLSQIQSLQSGIQSAQQMMARCPSCWKNFRQLCCLMTCSPNNSLFIDPTALSPDKKGIEQIDYYVDPLFRQGLYNSCKDVLFPSSNKKIMSFLCGMAADKCDAMKVLVFMGDPNRNGQSPFLIKYPMNVAGHPDIKPMNKHISLCNETVYEPNMNKTAPACSCQNCLISCRALPPDHPPKKWKLHVDIVDIHFNIISFAKHVAYLSFIVIFVAGIILYCNLSGKRQRFDFENSMDYQKDQVGPKTHMNKRIKVCFTRWGNICCDHPWIVICLSVLFVIVCAVGSTKLTVVTKSVRLSSSPGSNFSLFYYTAQINFSIKSGSKYHNKPTCYTGSSGSCQLYGPILRKQFLLKILEVQNHLIKMSVRFDNPERNSSYITLQDICMKPPYNNNCTVMSVLQYWQNDVKKLNACISVYGPGLPCADDGWDAEASWGDHLVACANNPTATTDATKLHLPCISLYGGPIEPSIAFGGYNDTSYIYAKNLIVTFVTQNHVDDSKTDKVKAWEKEFLKHMKNYWDKDLEVVFMVGGQLKMNKVDPYGFIWKNNTYI